MNMFLHEFRVYRKSTMIWTSSLLGLSLLVFSMYPSFSKEADAFLQLIEGFPEAVREALGLSINTVASILGFYSYIFTYVVLCGAIQAMNLGTSIISKELREKTADFLLTKPVTRPQVITAKLLAALTSLGVTNIVYLIGAFLLANIFKTEDFSTKIFLMISITLFFIQVIFLSLGILISVLFPKIKSVLSISLGVVFTFFFIGMLSSTAGDDALRYLSPFKYFNTTYIIANGRYEIPFLVLSLVFVMTAIGMSYFVYSKRDIDAV